MEEHDKHTVPKNKSRGRRKKRRDHHEGGHLPRKVESSTTAGVGQKLGGMLGNFAEKGLGKLFGFGEYKHALAGEIGHAEENINEGETPEVNSLVSPVSSNVVPLMHLDKEGSLRIARREFVRFVNIRTAQNNVILKINPGNIYDFRWVSNVAHSFQQYAFLGLAAEYVPTSGFAVGSDSAALGSVNMVFKYDVSGATWPALDVPSLLNFNGAVSGSPAAPSVCYMECDPKTSVQPVRFVDTESSTYVGMSQQNFIAADLILNSLGAQNALDVQCGQLWFTYEVLLMQPKAIDPSPVLEWKGMEAYRTLAKRRAILLGVSGPYTKVECLLREAEINRIDSIFASPAYFSTLETATYEHAVDMAQHGEKPGEIGVLPMEARDLMDLIECRVSGKTFKLSNSTDSSLLK